MRKLVYYIGVSLDGYISGTNGEFDFYPLSDQMAAWINARYPETLPTHIRKLVGLDGVPNKVFDTLLMGRGTYEPALDVPTTSPYAHLRQYVVSRTLKILKRYPVVAGTGIPMFSGQFHPTLFTLPGGSPSQRRTGHLAHQGLARA